MYAQHDIYTCNMFGLCCIGKLLVHDTGPFENLKPLVRNFVKNVSTN